MAPQSAAEPVSRMQGGVTRRKNGREPAQNRRAAGRLEADRHPTAGADAQQPGAVALTSSGGEQAGRPSIP